MSKKHAPAPPRRPVEDPAFAARERGKFTGAEHDHLTSEAATPSWWARGPPELALERVLTLDEVVEATSLSKDTILRRYRHLVRRLSPRRLGMKVRDVLTIGSEEPPTVA